MSIVMKLPQRGYEAIVQSLKLLLGLPDEKFERLCSYYVEGIEKIDVLGILMLKCQMSIYMHN